MEEIRNVYFWEMEMPLVFPVWRNLLEILDRIHEAFPACREVNMDATVTNIREKSDEELRALFQAGARGLYLGIESGMAKSCAHEKKTTHQEEAYMRR